MNPKIDFIPYGLIKDFNEPDLTLIQDTYEIDQIWKYLGIDPEQFDLYGLFVGVENGDYTEIYAYSGTVPYDYKTIYKMVDQ